MNPTKRQRSKSMSEARQGTRQSISSSNPSRLKRTTRIYFRSHHPLRGLRLRRASQIHFYHGGTETRRPGSAGIRAEAGDVKWIYLLFDLPTIQLRDFANPLRQGRQGRQEAKGAKKFILLSGLGLL
jgi:hypothetical protein